MKKTLALLLAITMVLALAACAPAVTTAPTAATTAAPSDGTTVPATIDPLEIKFSSTYQENETGGVVLKHFIDQLKTLSGGAVTVNISWGGTLFDPISQLDGVIDGAVDMIALGHMPHMDTLPSLSFPAFAPISAQNAVDYFNEIMFANAETSAIVQAEAAKLGIKYLNVIAGGANSFCAKYAFTDLQTLVDGSTTFGNFDAAPFEAIGLNVTPMAPPDTYDAIQRGMIDATQMALAPMTMLSWYEVAPYWMLDDTYAAGNFFTVNLEWWDGLTKAQQDVIQAASDETEGYSVTMFDESDAANIAIIEKATGNKFVQMTEADSAKWWGAIFEAKAKDALARAATNNMTAEMTKILEVAAEFTSYDWKH